MAFEALNVTLTDAQPTQETPLITLLAGEWVRVRMTELLPDVDYRLSIIANGVETQEVIDQTNWPSGGFSVDDQVKVVATKKTNVDCPISLVLETLT